MQDSTKRVSTLTWALCLLCFRDLSLEKGLLLQDCVYAGYETRRNCLKDTMAHLGCQILLMSRWFLQDGGDLDKEERLTVHHILSLIARAFEIAQSPYDVRNKDEAAKAQQLVEEMRDDLLSLLDEDAAWDALLDGTSERLDCTLAQGIYVLLLMRHAALDEHLPLIHRHRANAMVYLRKRTDNGDVLLDEVVTLFLIILFEATERLGDANDFSLFKTHMPVIEKLCGNSPFNSWPRKLLAFYYITFRPEDPVEAKNLLDFFSTKLQSGPKTSDGGLIHRRGDTLTQIVALLMLCDKHYSSYTDECLGDLFLAVSRSDDWEDAMEYVFPRRTLPRFALRVLVAAPRSRATTILVRRILESKTRYYQNDVFAEFAEMLRTLPNIFAWHSMMYDALYPCAEMLCWKNIDRSDLTVVAMREVIDVLVVNSMTDLMNTFRNGLSKLDSADLQKQEADQIVSQMQERLVFVSSAIARSRTIRYLLRERKEWCDQIGAELLWMRSRCPAKRFDLSRADEYTGCFIGRNEFCIGQICIMTLLCCPIVLNRNRPMRSSLRMLTIDIIRMLSPFMQYPEAI